MSAIWYIELAGVIIACIMFFDWFCEGYYFLRTFCAKKSLKKYGIGSWALINGATDKVGMGFAKVLAKYNFNIVLVSRNPEKLAAFELEIKGYGVNAISITKDISKCPENPEEFFNEINEKTKELDISILINNAGRGTKSLFHNITLQEIANHNALNLWPIVYLTKIFAKRMLTRPKPSGIINITAASSIIPLSRLTVYCAGKGFGNLFSLNVNEEIRYLVKKEALEGIDIISLQLAFAETSLVKNISGKPLIISPESCAENALRVLGKVNYSNGHWKHMVYAMRYRNFSWLVNSKLLEKIFLKKKHTNLKLVSINYSL